jgi:tetratricopeptide (TPR) repeat protein
MRASKSRSAESMTRITIERMVDQRNATMRKRMMMILAAMVLLLNIGGCQQGENKAVATMSDAPMTAQEWASKGASLRQADNKDQAVKAYDEAIKIDPNLEAAVYNRALIYAELGRDAEAAAARDMLLERKSPLAKKLQGLFALNSDANLSMGNNHIHAGEWDLAVKKYRVVLVYDPDSSDAYVGLGLVCLAQKKYDDAVAEFDQAIKRNRQAVLAHHNRGIANRERQQFKAAVTDFSIALELDPENPQTYIARASAFDGLGDNSSAAADRKKAAELELRKKKGPEKN